MEQLAENLWVLRFPLRLLGVAIGRTVTVIRLSSGKLVIHSTAPFTPEDIAQIRGFGEPAWLVEASLFHDSFAKEGSAAWSNLPYLAPEGFSKLTRIATTNLSPPPPEWAGELEVLQLGGMPKVREHVLFHRASGTLIVADVLFNFGCGASAWTRFVARHVMRFRKFIGTSPFFRLMIRNREAFRDSVAEMMKWEFDRVIVAHGEILEEGRKQRLRAVLAASGLLP